MSVTFGFYNSVNGDRKYDAIQMSSIFDGIIRDGVFQHLGTAMMVKESEGMIVNVGIGRAWFNHTWTLNDALLPLEVPISEVIFNRIDAVVLEVDARENSRANSIKIVKGTPATNPKNPEMIKANDRWQYPLAYIQVNAGVTSIRQANITNCVGTSDCPFVTGPLELMSIDALVAQWGDQWKEFYENQTSDMESTNAFWKQQWSTWYKTQTTEMETTNAFWKRQWEEWFYNYVNSNTAEMAEWRKDTTDIFWKWFNDLQAILEGDAAANLANQLLMLKKRTEMLERFEGDLEAEFAVYHKLYDNGYETLSDLLDSSDGTIVDSNLEAVIGRTHSSDLILDSNGDPICGRVIFVTK